MSYTDRRLREVFGEPRTPFGVITVGDFCQLPPVTKGRVADCVFHRALWRNHLRVSLAALACDTSVFVAALHQCLQVLS